HHLGSRQLCDAGRVIKDRGWIVGLANKGSRFPRSGSAIFVKREAPGESFFTEAHEGGEHKTSDPLQFLHFCLPIIRKIYVFHIGDTDSRVGMSRIFRRRFLCSAMQTMRDAKPAR